MTDGQVKYQQVAETRRHNLEMERIGAIDSNIKAREARVKEQNVEIAQRKLPFEISEVQSRIGNNKIKDAQAGQAMTTDLVWGTMERGRNRSMSTLNLAGKIISMLFN